MTDERRDETPPEVELSREAGEGECDRLRAEVARLTRERDALMAWAVKHSMSLGTDFWAPTCWARGDRGYVYADTLAGAVRRAAGLDQEGGAP